MQQTMNANNTILDEVIRYGENLVGKATCGR